MIPETWLPTLTVVTAERVPVAVTVDTTSPFVTFSFRNFGPLFFSFERRRTPPATTATTIAAPIRAFFISSAFPSPDRSGRRPEREPDDQPEPERVERPNGFPGPDSSRGVLQGGLDPLPADPGGRGLVDSLVRIGARYSATRCRCSGRRRSAARNGRPRATRARPARRGAGPLRRPARPPSGRAPGTPPRAGRKCAVRSALASLRRNSARPSVGTIRAVPPDSPGPKRPEPLVVEEGDPARQAVAKRRGRIRFDALPFLLPGDVVVLPGPARRPVERVASRAAGSRRPGRPSRGSG